MTPERAGKIGCLLAWIALAATAVAIIGLVAGLMSK